MNIKSTLIKIVLTVVVFIGSSVIIAVMQEAHVFGKFLVVGVLLFTLKLIWSGGKSDIANSTNVPSNSQPLQYVNNIKPDFEYNGGHNSQQSSKSTHSHNVVDTESTIPVSPRTTESKKGFSGSNPYSKN